MADMGEIRHNLEDGKLRFENVLRMGRDAVRQAGEEGLHARGVVEAVSETAGGVVALNKEVPGAMTGFMQGTRELRQAYISIDGAISGSEADGAIKIRNAFTHLTLVLGRVGAPANPEFLALAEQVRDDLNFITDNLQVMAGLGMSMQVVLGEYEHGLTEITEAEQMAIESTDQYLQDIG